MPFPLASAVAAELVALEETDSTNDDLAARARDAALPEFVVVATLNQRAGKGRLGRSWVAPPGTALAASVLVRPQAASVPLDDYGWIPLIAGLAMTRAVGQLVSGREVLLKWPNDVHIEGKKVCGVLTELLGDGASVIVGAGLNLTICSDDLPVPAATSLTLNGVAGTAVELADRALAAYLGELRELWDAFRSGEPGESSAVRGAVAESCSTLGRQVRVDLPDGSSFWGSAVDLDSSGRLRVRSATNGELQSVAAGDITHLRYE